MVSNLLKIPPYLKYCLYLRFPGLNRNDKILDLLNLLVRNKNPLKEISASIARKGGYDPCERCAENDRLWTMTDPCDSGFIRGFESGYCYRVLSIQEN